LFAISSRVAISEFKARVLFLIAFLQMLDFLVRSEIFAYDDHALYWLHTLCGILTLRYQETFHWYALIFSAFGIVWLLASTFAVAALFVKAGTLDNHPFVSAGLAQAMVLIPTIAYIPLLNVIVEAFSCVNEQKTFSLVGSVLVVTSNAGDVAASARN